MAEALDADKVDIFLYEADKDSLVALGTSDTPTGRQEHELGLDRFPRSNGGRSPRCCDGSDVLHRASGSGSQSATWGD